MNGYVNNANYCKNYDNQFILFIYTLYENYNCNSLSQCFVLFCDQCGHAYVGKVTKEVDLVLDIKFKTLYYALRLIVVKFALQWGYRCKTVTRDKRAFPFISLR